MQIINKYRMILAVVPAFLVILGAYLMDALPKKSMLSSFMDVITEKDLEDLLKKNGLSKTSVKMYQMLRFVFGAVFALVFIVLSNGSLLNKIVISIVIVIAVYKLLYLYLVYLDSQRIKKLNQELPYMIKSIAYLVYTFPVANALNMAIDSAPEVFKYDLERLCIDIDNDPVSFGPYQNFINRYDNRLNNLDNYLKILYRMSKSSAVEGSKLLENLNSTISNDISVVRKQKNQSTNSAISYLGMIPVILVSLVLTVVMLIVVMSAWTL